LSIKVSDLAKELNISSRELIKAIEEITGEKIKSASKKIDDEIADLIRTTLGLPQEEVEEEVKEEIKEKRKFKLFDVSHELKIPFDELANKLRAKEREEELKRKIEERKKRIEKLVKEKVVKEEKTKIEVEKKAEEKIKREEIEEKRD